VKSRRFLFVLVVGVLLAGALAAGRASSTPSPAAASAKVAPNAATLAESSTVWFCPGLSPALAHQFGRVTFSNIGGTSAQVVVTDLADKGDATHVTVDVAPETVVTRSRDSIGTPGALTVETFGGRVLVEEGIEGLGAIDTAPCATQTSAHWYFAAGTTPRGVQQWLVIENPYPSDAKVNVTLRTSNGVLRPGDLQSLDVIRRSRSVIAIHNYAVRVGRVAVAVDAQVGTVVASQMLVYTTDAGTPGVALSIGAPAPATDWTFAGGVVAPNSTAFVAIVNVGDQGAQVDVQATTESAKQVVAPKSLTVGQDDVVWVQLGHCATAGVQPCVAVPGGADFSLDVRSEQDVAIVAQTLSRFGDTPGLVGTVTSPGETAPARAWAFGRMRVEGERSTMLTLFNPGAGPAVAHIALVFHGRVQRSRSLQRVVVPPGRGTTVVVVGGAKPPKFDGALTIDATEPVFVERTIVANGEVANSVGVVVG
jgi:hypothetical protein